MRGNGLKKESGTGEETVRKEGDGTRNEIFEKSRNRRSREKASGKAWEQIMEIRIEERKPYKEHTGMIDALCTYINKPSCG